MTDSKIPYLCGGVLFFLLVQTIPSKITARDHVVGIKDDHKDPLVMEDLLYAITGERGYGAAKDTSKFRECLIDGSVNVPFNDKSVRDSFNDNVKNKYPAILKRMTEFVGWHITASKCEWFVKAVLEIIREDKEISDSSLFYIQPNGTPVLKTDLKDIGEVWLPAFMIGVIHYIEVYRYNKNTIGIETLDALGSKQHRNERVYSGSLGAKINKTITVHMEYKDPDACEKSDTGSFDENSETVDNESHADDTKSNKNTIVIQHQTNVVQNGENNYNLTNNGTMNFSF